MQLYSDFTHSFDLSQVIDFKPQKVVLANYARRKQDMGYTLENIKNTA